MLLLLCFTSCCLLTAAPVSAVTMETVVGVAGRNVTLPCRSAAGRSGVEVCWGRGQPALFTCHNAVISTAAGQVTYRKSPRFWAASSSLTIGPVRAADSGLYHCRVELPGPFNDRTASLLLLVLAPSRSEAGTLNAPHTAAGVTAAGEGEQTGSDVTNTTRPMVALVQSSEQQVNSLHSFITNTLRVSAIIFIPAVLLTAAYRVWRTNQRTEPGGRLNQSERQESSWV